MRRLICLLAFMPGAAVAQGLCDVTDPAQIFAALEGDWSREGTMVLDNAVTEMVRASEEYSVQITGQGQIGSAFLDSLTGDMAQTSLPEPRPYDVDRVDDMLDSTGRADFADLLSDTKCGPEALPQLQIDLSAGQGITVTGTITYVAYFTDRVLELGQFELKSDETVLFVTETALLTRDNSDAQ